MSRVLRNVKNVVKNYTQAEVLARDATSNSSSPCSQKLLNDIARYTFHPVSLYEIHGIIVKRINDDGKKWRHILKGLMLFEYIALHGSDSVYDLLCQSSVLIDTLVSFTYVDKDGSERGKSIRSRASRLMSLVKDRSFFEAEREKVKMVQSSITRASVREDPSSRANRTSAVNNNKPSVFASEFPKSLREEQTNLYIALAISKKEADDLASKSQPKRASASDVFDGASNIKANVEANLLPSSNSNPNSPMDRPRQMYDSSEDRRKKLVQQAQKIVQVTQKPVESDKQVEKEESNSDILEDLFLVPVVTPEQKVLQGFQSVAPTPQVVIGFQGVTPAQQPQGNFQAYGSAQQPQGNFQAYGSAQQPQANFQAYGSVQQPQANFQAYGSVQQPQTNFQAYGSAQQPQANVHIFIPSQQPQGYFPPTQQTQGYFQNAPSNQLALDNFTDFDILKCEPVEKPEPVKEAYKSRSSEDFSLVPLEKTDNLLNDLEDDFLKQNLDLIEGTEGYLHSRNIDQFEKPKPKGSPIREIMCLTHEEDFLIQMDDQTMNFTSQPNSSAQNKNPFDD